MLMTKERWPAIRTLHGEVRCLSRTSKGFSFNVYENSP